MLISSYPRSGSSWFCRLMADSLGVILGNKNKFFFVNDNSLYDEILKKRNQNSKDPVFILKGHFENFREIKKWKYNVDNIFCYIYRDPRDIMVSYFFFENYKKRNLNKYSLKNVISELYYAIFGKKKWRFNMFKINQEFDVLFEYFIKEKLPEWCEYMDNWHSNNGVLSIKYEDLKRNPKKTLIKLFKELRIEVKEEAIIKAIKKWEIENFRKHTNDLKVKENERMVRKAIIGDWKNYHNKNHKKVAKKIVGNYLVKENYEKDNNW